MNKISRRNLLKWAPPVVTVVALPAHAQMSFCEDAEPVVTAGTPKCAGDPPIGNSVISIASSNSLVDIEIISITYSPDSTGDTIIIPALPMTAMSAVPVEIEWEGPASDAQSCLPTNTIEFEITYNCNNAFSTSVLRFNLTDVLAAAVA